MCEALKNSTIHVAVTWAKEIPYLFGSSFFGAEQELWVTAHLLNSLKNIK